jgi:hypothetical protein
MTILPLTYPSVTADEEQPQSTVKPKIGKFFLTAVLFAIYKLRIDRSAPSLAQL